MILWIDVGNSVRIAQKCLLTFHYLWNEFKFTKKFVLFSIESLACALCFSLLTNLNAKFLRSPFLVVALNSFTNLSIHTCWSIHVIGKTLEWNQFHASPNKNVIEELHNYCNKKEKSIVIYLSKRMKWCMTHVLARIQLQHDFCTCK